MGLYYPQQHIKALIGSKNATSFELVPATLTTAYTGNSKIITTDYHPQMVIYAQYTPGASGAGNYVTLKLEFSSDGINFQQETVELPTIGTTNLYTQERKFDNNGATVALTTYKIRLAVPIADKFFKLSAKETLAGGSAGIFYAEALLSGK
jgi:hypothetical protein